MSEKTRNELLSAYLDGELTAVERVEVEALLASDAESQQLLEEMRALRVELQQLPSFELASDFSQRVLRQAERSILLAPAPEARRSDWDEDRKRRWTRRLLWPGLAVAAALLISVMTNIVPTSREGARVAVAPERSTETPALRALPETPARDGAAFEGGAAAVRSVDEAPGAARRLDKSMTTFDSPALQSDEIEAAELMIVEAEVDPQALRERVFEKLLAGQQIVWEEHEAREEEGESTDEAAVEYVYVEAPLEQIEGALAEMQAQPSQFVSVKVDPAPADRRQVMFVEQYGRAAARAERAAPAESSAEVLFEEPEQAIRRKVVEWLPTRSVQSGQDEMPGRAQRLVVAPSQQMGLEAFEFSAGEEQRLRSVQGAAAPSAGVPLDRLPQERSRALFLLRAAPTEK